MRTFLNARVIGQERLAERLVLALLADGHVLLEGRPGLAKTRAATALADGLEATFRRIVLGPGSRGVDLVGAVASTGPPDRKAVVAAGPVFCNVLLAEGIGHASPDARLALLDAMAERQVTVDGVPRRLPDVFMVFATRTAPDPAASDALGAEERDRFLLHLRVGYPDEAAERRMLGAVRAEPRAGHGDPAFGRLPLAVVLAARAQVRAVRVGPGILRRITALVAATRKAASGRSGMARWIRSGAGPRGSIALERCARAHAWLAGRRRVAERDLAAVAHDALRHRLELEEGAAAAGVTADAVIDELLARPSH